MSCSSEECDSKWKISLSSGRVPIFDRAGIKDGRPRKECWSAPGLRTENEKWSAAGLRRENAVGRVCADSRRGKRAGRVNRNRTALKKPEREKRTSATTV